MIIRKKTFLIICLALILFLTGCFNNNESSVSNNNINTITIGQAKYTVKNIDASPITKDIGLNEEIFAYYANSKYLVYGISSVDSNKEYLLTKNLYAYDYNQEKIYRKITFSEDCYVGDAIINENGNLYYSVVPINKITTNSAIWEIHSNVNNQDNIITEGFSFYPDNYPQFAMLETNPIYVYENQTNDVYEYGCNLISNNQVSTLFENKSNISDVTSNKLLNREVVSNGKIASFMNYEDGVLYHTFINKDGTIMKHKFENHMYHMGMINDGLMISKITNQDQSNQYYQVSIIGADGKEDSFKTYNSAYFRFTSSNQNESMAIDNRFNLYFFEYKDRSLIKTQILIDPSVDGKGTTPFYIGDKSYLICNFINDNDLQLHVVTIK